MSDIHNTQCNPQNAKHYTIISAFMQPRFKLWSSADHYGHLVPAPKVKTS
jgi:hypothetical protein